jgi:hypothetical protein
VADEQQPPVRRQARQLGERLTRVEVAGERRMHGQQLALLLAPVLGGELCRPARARLRAEQDRVEARLQPLQRDPGGVRLGHAALGQTALGVRACAMGLGVPVT